MQTEQKPYQGSQVLPDTTSKLSKKEQVAEMFNDISGKYDFLNHFFSLGIDRVWRRKAIAAIAPIQPKKILDVATGTGDLAIAAAKLHPDQITGIDIAEQMLEAGRKKIEKKHLSPVISLQKGDSEALPFPADVYDAVTCAYGILEFSQPKTFPVKQLYRFYFRHILPLLGKIVSKHETAYTYLPESVMVFPEGQALCDKLEAAGFKNARAVPLAFGITTLYTAGK
jgi:demethylmenaquinone methyltransferase/2-methoxy-6-polyprenyl-1,4-benzoquinol methylase